MFHWYQDLLKVINWLCIEHIPPQAKIPESISPESEVFARTSHILEIKGNKLQPASIMIRQESDGSVKIG